MLKSQKLQREQSEVRQRLNAALDKDELTDDERAQMERDTKRSDQIESELRAALTVEGEDTRQAAATEPDSEHRERLELRSRATLTNYFLAAMGRRHVTGAEQELAQAAGIADGHVPVELFDVERRSEQRVVTAAPTSGTSTNLDPIYPAIFSKSVVPMLGVDMPRVASGTYSTARIDQSLTAGTHAAGDAAVASAATFAVGQANPKRISGRLSIRAEDIATVGPENFESSLRENLTLVMSDALDNQGLNGEGANNDLIGIFHRLTDPSDPTSVSDFDAFAAAHASGIDGLWANTLADVLVVVGPNTYALAARTFQSATNYKGEMSAAAYAMANTGGFWTNARMPDPDSSNFQQAILFRKGRAMGMRTAVCPMWSSIDITDIYSDSASATHHVTMHLLVGNVILVQPRAYQQVAFQVA